MSLDERQQDQRLPQSGCHEQRERGKVASKVIEVPTGTGIIGSASSVRNR